MAMPGMTHQDTGLLFFVLTFCKNYETMTLRIFVRIKIELRFTHNYANRIIFICFYS